MIHAENADCIGWLTERLERAGNIAPKFHAAARPQIAEREATHRAIALAELVDTPILIVHVSGQEAIEQIRWAQEPRPAHLRRNLPAISLPDRRRSGGAGFPRREMRLQPAAARPREPGGGLGRPARRPVSGLLVRPRPVPLRRSEGKKVAKATSRFACIPNGIPGLETRLPLLFSAGVERRAHRPLPVCRAHRDQPSQDVWALSAQGLDRDRRRRGSGDLGRRIARSRSPTTCCITTSTTRPTKACGFAAGR